MADELQARFEGLKRAMAAPLPTPEEVAAGNAEDRVEAERLHRARPGVPLHHVYAVLQAKRAADRIEAAKRAPQEDGAPAPLLWGESVAACRADGSVEIPVTDDDGNTVGVVKLRGDQAEILADMLAEATKHLVETAHLTEAEAAEAWLCGEYPYERPTVDVHLPGDQPARTLAASSKEESRG